MTIALLCPSRARPELFRRMVDSARATTSDKSAFKVYMAITKEELDSYEPHFSDSVSHVQIMPDGCPTGFKWNLLAEFAMRDDRNTHFMLAADDMIFTTPLWDKELVGGKPHVYHLRDSRSEEGTPHPIVTREYIDAMGYFLPPLFLHWYIDTWTVEIAKANDCFTHLKDFMLVHDKPWDKGVADDTHNFLHKMGWLNRDRHVNDKCQHILEMEKNRLKQYLAKEKAA